MMESFREDEETCGGSQVTCEKSLKQKVHPQAGTGGRDTTGVWDD